MSAGATKDLLVELLVEELPPKALKRLGEAFAEELFRGDDPPDAIAAMSDELALGALRAAAGTGRGGSLSRRRTVSCAPALSGLAVLSWLAALKVR